jgi:predicted ATPase/DNA-binding CsgD family transcriptional regulator/Tfp pilus assembly protein PilF
MSVSPRFTRRPSPLPVALTPLQGRERESGQLRRLLDDPTIRLVTLTGPGGVGKTRLALHVAAQVLDGDRDVAYVPLAAVHEPAQVVPAIVQSFGVFSDPQDAPEDQLVEVLGDEDVLLVLDNIEQVLEVAPAIAAILARAPGVTMLVTSQAPLNISGEQLFPLAPLPTPEASETRARDIVKSDAVALFIQRARAVNPNLAVDDRVAGTIAEVCRRLDGLPLAIELAAARTNILSPEALLARLSNRLQVLGGDRRGVPDRLRTMRSAVAWSYDLLPAEEQALFRQMSVFVGGIALDAVEAITPEGERDAFDLLGALVDHSLIQPDPTGGAEARFLMLETLRDFGLEQLEVGGEIDAARRAHAEWVRNLAERAEPELTGPEQGQWLDALDADSENIRAAVEWSLAGGEAALALEIVAATWRFAPDRGLTSDYRGWLARGLALLDPAPSSLRTRAELGAGYLAEDQRALDIARDHFAAAQAGARAIGDWLLESRADIGLGTVEHDRGDYVAALGHHEAALAAARAASDERAIAIALGNVGAVSYFQGNLVDAERSWSEALRLVAALGDVRMEAITTNNLGAIASERGDFVRAEELLTRTLELQRQLNSQRDLPFTLINLGEAARGLGDITLAHDYLAEAVQLLREAGNPAIEGHALHGLSAVALDRGELAEAASLTLESTRLVAEADDRHTVVDNAELLAEIAIADGRHAVAAELAGAASAQREALQAPPNPVAAARLESIAAALAAALDPDTLVERRAEGARLTEETLPRRIGVIAREIIGPRRPLGGVQAVGAAERVDAADLPKLTNRELEVLRLLAQGQSTAEVSEALYISQRTTSTHITNILGKLDVDSRTAAVALALRLGLV